jgi:membrane protein implicated in regulation of membrane protease activity
MRFLRDNGLTIALMALFAISLIGQVFAGWRHENEQLAEHFEPAISLAAYVVSGDFLSALFENWESEFLQMSAYVVLTAYLVQRGSPESKKPDEQNPQDADPKRSRDKAHAPWPVRRGGLALQLYSHSLGLVLILLFLASFVLHWVNSWRKSVEDAGLHGQAPETLMQYLGGSEFWFESFQNWQSEFLSTAVLIVLAIWLRERGSPESKPVSAPHSQTGA